MTRKCSIDNETINVVIDNIKEHFKRDDIVYLEDVKVLLEKALEGIECKKDLSDGEKLTIKSMREIMKGL